jgi:hypothetical protein
MLNQILGLALVVAALLLSLPGVRVARAEEGPMCRAAQPAGNPSAVERMAALLQAQAQGSDVKVVTLNNRGYNYPRASSSRVDPSIPTPELKR